MKHHLSFVRHFSKFPEMTLEIRKWLAQTIGSAIVADHKISRQEVKFVDMVRQAFSEEQDMLQILQKALESKQPPPPTPIQVSPELAEAIFRYILKICLSDRNLAAEEIRYLHQVGTVLEIDTQKKRTIFKQSIFRAKEDFFLKLLNGLEGQQRFWLAFMILKIIYADHEIHPKELPYLNHVAELVDNNPQKIKFVKEEAARRSIEDFGKISLTPTQSHYVLEYLLRIGMSDQDFNEKEWASIQTIAHLLDYEEKKLKALIEEVKSDHQFLFS